VPVSMYQNRELANIGLVKDTLHHHFVAS
jgi:hypothetical protein